MEQRKNGSVKILFTLGSSLSAFLAKLLLLSWKYHSVTQNFLHAMLKSSEQPEGHVLGERGISTWQLSFQEDQEEVEQWKNSSGLKRNLSVA